MASELTDPPPGQIQRLGTWEGDIANALIRLPWRIKVGDVLLIATVRQNPVDGDGWLNFRDFGVDDTLNPYVSIGSIYFRRIKTVTATVDPGLQSSSHTHVFVAVYRGLAPWDSYTAIPQYSGSATLAWSGSPLVLQATVGPLSYTPGGDTVVFEYSSGGVVPSSAGTNKFTIGSFTIDTTANTTKICHYEYPNAPHGAGIPDPERSSVDIWERRPTASPVPALHHYASPSSWTTGDYTNLNNWGYGVNAVRRILVTSAKATISRPALGALVSHVGSFTLTAAVPTPPADLPAVPAGQIQRVATWAENLNNSVAALPFRLQVNDVVFIASLEFKPHIYNNIDLYGFTIAEGGNRPTLGALPMAYKVTTITQTTQQVGAWAAGQIYVAVYRGLAPWDSLTYSNQQYGDYGAWTGVPPQPRSTLQSAAYVAPSDVVMIEFVRANTRESRADNNASYTIGRTITPSGSAPTKIFRHEHFDVPNSDVDSARGSTDVWERRPTVSPAPAVTYTATPSEFRSGESSQTYWGYMASSRITVTTSIKATVTRPSLNALSSVGSLDRLLSPARPPLEPVVSHAKTAPLYVPNAVRPPLASVTSYLSPNAVRTPARPPLATPVAEGHVPSLVVDPIPVKRPINTLYGYATPGHLRVGDVVAPLNVLASYAAPASLDATHLNVIVSHATPAQVRIDPYAPHLNDLGGYATAGHLYVDATKVPLVAVNSVGQIPGLRIVVVKPARGDIPGGTGTYPVGA